MMSIFLSHQGKLVSGGWGYSDKLCLKFYQLISETKTVFCLSFGSVFPVTWSIINSSGAII